MNTPIDEATRDALARLAAAGSDLSQPMVIDFYVGAPHAVAARAVAATIRRAGFDVWVRSDETKEQWVCVCRKGMLPSPSMLTEAERLLGRLAAPFGGRAQGWGSYGNVTQRLSSWRTLDPHPNPRRSTSRLPVSPLTRRLG
jgi:hypothetical protein